MLLPSISRRLFLAVFLACALVWGGMYLLGRSMVYRAETGEFDRDMLALVEVTTAAASRAGSTTELVRALAGVDDYLGAFRKNSGTEKEFLAFHVWDAAGQLIARSTSATADYQGSPSVMGFGNVRIGGAAYRVYGALSGTFRIEVTQSLRSRQAAFDDVMLSREGFLSPLLVGFPLLMLPIFLAIRSGLRPLRVLAQELSDRAPDDLRPVRTPYVYSELAPVTQELNATLQKLRILLERERQLLADAAHELRTPLALIALQFGSLVSASGALEREAAQQRMRRGLGRAMRLVNQLLTLARLDADADADRRVIDLGDTIRDVMVANTKLATERSTELSYNGPDSLLVCAPGDAIESLVANLVSNGILHGKEFGRLHVDVQLENSGRLTLLVRDDGPGIDPGHREKVFERFHRGSRSHAPGSGLGLSIVLASARQLGASIEIVEGLENAGVGVRVQWMPQSAEPSR
jgi:two-component system, OmpR family, sensor histidine kinase QseC